MHEDTTNDQDDVDLMEVEDAIALAGMNHENDEEELRHMNQVRRRYENSLRGEENRFLPVKTERGLILNTQTFPDMDEPCQDEADATDQQETVQDVKVRDKGDVKRAEVPKTTSVLNLVAERQKALDDLRLEVGNLASSFLENPEERIQNLDRLILMLEELPALLRNTGFRLLSTSINELLKDVIPNYKIAHHNSENTLQRKETRKLQNFENAILRSARNHLTYLEKNVKNKHRLGSSVGTHSVKCLCELLISHPHFTYAPNIIRLITPLMNHKSQSVQAIVKDAFENLFKNDKKGEVSLTAVRSIKAYVKGKKYKCKAAFFDCMTTLRLSYIDMTAPENARDNGKVSGRHNQRLSKKQKKHQKQLEKVEKEMLEARGEESKAQRNKNFTEVSKIMFELVFRIIKSACDDGVDGTDRLHSLLPSALKLVSKFCHTINVDYLDNLIRVLSQVLYKNAGQLSTMEKLLCIKTAFDILTGPGEFLTYDPGHFTKELYQILPMLDLNEEATAFTVCSIVKSMLLRRKRFVSKGLVQALTKALCGASLHLTPDESAEYLQTVKEVKSAHLRTFEAMLECEDEVVPNAVSALGLSNSSASVVLWELALLKNHFSPGSAKHAAILLAVRE